VTGQRKLGAMKADKGQFDEVLRRMLTKNPKKNSEIKAKRSRVERRKNPETDPARLPVFDFKEKVELTAEEFKEIKPPKIDR
jgi:hypothetical protein